MTAMTYADHRNALGPTGIRKLLYFHWPLVLVITAIATLGWLMLYSISGGDFSRWAEPQMNRYILGLAALIVIGLLPIWFWQQMAWPAYAIGILMLLYVEFFGSVGMGAQRWIDLGFMMLQPSELMKVALIMALAAYYARLDDRLISHPFWVLLPVVAIMLPTALVLMQPNLGTALMTVTLGGILMFAAGVSLWYFAGVISTTAITIWAIFASRGTEWQLLFDYQYRRIDTFLDPTADPLGAGYNIIQAQIALGSGGWSGKGFMQGTQSRLNFLPEKHTDFIFTSLGEEFGYLGAISLLVLYALVLLFCIWAALRSKDRFSQLLIIGVAVNLFLYIAVNLSMVMGMAPVVGVPLPLLSYGGSATLVVMIAFGLVQSAIVHRSN
jgi:rod shape determining protein RodA